MYFFLPFFLLLFYVIVTVSAFETRIIDNKLHGRLNSKSTFNLLYFKPNDFLHQTWHDACHLHKDTKFKRLKTEMSISSQECATFRGGHLCCYVDKYGWMPVYDEVDPQERFFGISDMGQHSAEIPKGRALNTCPKIGVTDAPTVSPTAKPTESPTRGVSSEPTPAPSPTPAPTDTPAPTTTPPPSTAAPTAAAEESDIIADTVLYSGVGLLGIGSIIMAIEFGPAVVSWIQLRVRGQAYIPF